MAHAGIASRRECERLILKGHVTVNGEVVRELGTKVDLEADEVRVDTVPLSVPKDPMVVLLMKPKGYVSTTQDDRGRRTVLQLLPTWERRLYPAGRLDEDSEGLLLLSDDGTLTNLITHPRFGIPKTYEIRLRGKIESAAVKRAEAGVWLSDGKTAPARIRVRHRTRDHSIVEVTLTEGRNRELRRVFAKVGHPVLALCRTRIGNLTLKGLGPGQWRKLSAKEIRELKAMSKG